MTHSSKDGVKNESSHPRHLYPPCRERRDDLYKRSRPPPGGGSVIVMKGMLYVDLLEYRSLEDLRKLWATLPDS